MTQNFAAFLSPQVTTRYLGRPTILSSIFLPLHRLETSRTLAYKRLKIGPKFLPTLRKLCILLYCQASHTEVSKRNSTKFCDMLKSEPYLQMHVNNLSGSHPQKLSS